MTLEQLRIFIAVAEREHVTKAARDLSLTQSATSAAVAALEKRHQTKLFDRIGRRIVLTEAGQIFLREARAVLARAATAEAVLADLAGLKYGSLKLAASQTVANYWLPRIIHLYQERHPGISVNLTIGNTETVAAMVRDGLADTGFVEGAIDDPVLTVDTIAEDVLVLVAAPDHPWAATPPVPPRDFQTARWIFREHGSGTRSIFEATLPALGVDPADLHVGLELPSNEAVRGAVAAGAGVTVISKLVANAALKAGVLVAVDLTLPKRHFFALRHKERHATRAQQELHRLLAEEMSAPAAKSARNAP